MNNVTPFIAGDAQFRACQITYDFINTRVRPRVDEAAKGNPIQGSTTFQGALLRVIAWLRTLGKLNEPADFQAVTVASRTLFEIAIDLTLLHFDGQNPVAKLMTWEESAKLKLAEACRDYHQAQGAPLSAHDPKIEYIGRESPRLLAERMRLWNIQRHPNRWTGRNLREDARAATQLFNDGRFDEYYETQYAQTCWYTHGSGLAGIREVSEDMFPFLSCMAFKASVRFALVSAEVSLRRFGLWDVATLTEFDEHRADRLFAAYSIMSGIPREIIDILARA